MRVATICARAGSKGFPGKNLAEINGKSLIRLAVEQARDTQLFDLIIASSDSGAILDEALSCGATHLISRPEFLSGDDASKPETIKHAVESTLDYIPPSTTIVDLDVTSPLRNIQDIAGAVTMLESMKCCSVLTGCLSRRNPYFNIVSVDPDGSVNVAIKPITPIYSRQNAPKCYDLNAAVHVWNSDCLLSSPQIIYQNTTIYEMPQWRSLDIDSKTDFEIVKFLYERNRGINEG